MPLRYFSGTIGDPNLYIGRGAIGDPNLFTIGDPNLYAPVKLATPPELFQFRGWNGMAMQAVSLWKRPGFELCDAAQDLGIKMPFLPLSLISSTRGWFTTAQGTGSEWFAFLACSQVAPWKSTLNDYGKGY